MERDDLEQAIDEAMVRDRRGLRSRLRRLNRSDGRARRRLVAAVNRSRAARAARDAGRPVPEFPAELPITAQRHAIAAALERHPVIVVCGETGSGKTTQLPKICLAAGRGTTGLIGHTQPRRIAARSVAARIARELGGKVGGAVGCQGPFRDPGRPGLVRQGHDGRDPGGRDRTRPPFRGIRTRSLSTRRTSGPSTSISCSATSGSCFPVAPISA